jgi:hypothetical protein
VFKIDKFQFLPIHPPLGDFQSLMPQTDDVAVTSSGMLIGLASLATLEVSGHGAEDPMDVPSVEGPMGASGVEIPMSVALSLDYPLSGSFDA